MKRFCLMMVLALALGLLPGTKALAAPAYDGLASYVQPDQTRVYYRVMGDEKLHWKETPEGDVILLDEEDGYYHYAQLRNGRVEPSEARLGSGKKPFVRLDRSQLLSVFNYALRNAVALPGLSMAPAAFIEGLSAAPAASLSAASYAAAVPDPEQNVLVLLIEYDNISMARTEAFWSSRFFGAGQSSLADYYDEVSKGGLSVLPAPETAGTSGDGVVRVSLPVSHPAVDGFSGNEQAVFEAIAMDIEAAIETAGPSLGDLPAYDTDGSGILEQDELHLVVIFAGYEAAAGEEDVNAIWAHAMDYEGGGIGSLPGGVAFGGYQAVGENMWPGTPMSIGVFCHEFGHSLGLPDLYDYGYDSEGLGCVSLMAGGSWNYDIWDPDAAPGSSPAHPDAWCKAALGFAPVVETSADGEYTLRPSWDTSGNILKIPSGAPGQYFLAELRTFGGYDAALDGWLDQGGVAIYHVDENVMAYYGAHPEAGYWNDNRYRKAVDLEEANAYSMGYNELDYPLNPYLWDGGLLYTAQAGRNLFGPGTTPGSGLNSLILDAPFAEIPENGLHLLPSGNSVSVLSLGASEARLSVAVGPELLSTGSIADQTYTGQALKPALAVWDGAELLEAGTDYTLSYRSNVNPGRATVVVTGQGDYAGRTGMSTFVIVPKSLSSITLTLSPTYSPSSYRYRTIKASWAPVTGATGYTVAYRASTATKWTYVRVSGTSFTRVLSAGTKYLVRVSPYVAVNVTERHYAPSYTPEKAIYTLKAVTVSLSKTGTHSVKVSWNNISGETGYRIYRATSYSGTYTLKKVVSSAYSSWTDTSTYKGKTYYYKVRAYRAVGGVNIYGPYSAIKKIIR